ncbi:MAG: tetratricopeptide repeat protein, partial [Armatimonadota bacterium]
GDIPAAAAVAEALVARSPTLGSFMLLGLVRVARGEDDVAAAAFNRAIASEEVGEPGGSALVRTQFGRFHARRGRHNLAHALYGEALRILPQYPLALVHLAELDARVGRYREAEGHLSRVVTISAASPNVFDHVVLRGLARLKDLQGDAAGARALQDEAEAGLRRDVAQGAFGHRRELARLLLERGRPEDLSKALELMRAEVRVRHDPETLDALAWVLTRAGEWQEARQAMRDALQWGLRDAGMHYRAGTIEEALGNHAQARKFFASALQIDPTFNEHARRVSGMGL